MSDQLSMREVARRLGVSQIRVRELIRKGTISAEKITEDGGERWSVSAESVSAYEARRAENTSGGTEQPAAGPTSTPERRAEAVPSEAAPTDPEPSLGTLVGELGQQAQRIRTLIAEIEKASAYLDGLRAAQRSIETELARARERAKSAPAPAPPKDTPEDKPKKAAKKPAPAQKGGGPKASGGAEMKAAAPQADAPSEGMKGGGPQATEKKQTQPGETAVAAALREAGVAGTEEADPKKPAKPATKKKSSTKKKKKSGKSKSKKKT